MDITAWLRGLATNRRKAFGEEGMAGCRFEEAAAAIERLRDDFATSERLRDHAVRELGKDSALVERLRGLVRELHRTMLTEAGIHYQDSDLGERVVEALGIDEQSTREEK